MSLDPTMECLVSQYKQPKRDADCLVQSCLSWVHLERHDAGEMPSSPTVVSRTGLVRVISAVLDNGLGPSSCGTLIQEIAEPAQKKAPPSVGSASCKVSRGLS